MEDNIVEYGFLKLNSEYRTIQHSGSSVQITRQQCAVLEVLMRRGGKMVSHEHLRKILWNDQRSSRRTTVAISVTISNIRQHLRPIEMDIINIRSMGYVLKICG